MQVKRLAGVVHARRSGSRPSRSPWSAIGVQRDRQGDGHRRGSVALMSGVGHVVLHARRRPDDARRCAATGSQRVLEGRSTSVHAATLLAAWRRS